MSGSQFPTVLQIDPASLDRMDTDDHLLGIVTLFGVDHHLGLIRVVRRSGRLEATNPQDDDVLNSLFGIFDVDFATVEVPGHEGRYVAYMHPCED